MRAAKSRPKSHPKAASISAAVKVASLPAPEAIDHLPWPYFAVPAVERRRVVARHQPQTVTLGTLSATVPVVALHTAPAMTIPQTARRVAAALRPPVAAQSPAAPPATRALPGTQRPATQPARPPRQAAPVPVTAPIPIPPLTGPVAGGPAIEALKPRRVAGPLTSPTAPSNSAPAPSSASRSPGTVALVRTTVRQPIATVRLPPAPDAARLVSWALALGLLGVLCGFVTGVPAALCGHLALRRLARTSGAGSLRRRAQWAIALGYATSLFWASYLLLTVVR